MNNSGRRGLIRAELPFVAIAAALVCLAFLFAAVGIPPWIPPAVIVRLGVPSPLTGMTRSFVAVASGDILGAFTWHPLGPLVFAACIALPVVAFASWVRASRFERLMQLLQGKALRLSVLLLVAITWVRQIAFYG